MIISDKKQSDFNQFAKLVYKTRDFLNEKATEAPNYFLSRNGRKLEEDIFVMIEQVARGTEFEGSVKLISGQKFPDIVAEIAKKKLFGIEVKSTTQDHWITTGNSVLESTRVDGVERIFLMFGKLSNPIFFKARPYEECLSDVVVTHYPRYRINMDLENGHTIFDRINLPYEQLRKLDNPVIPIVNYYKGQLKDGESLWWLDNGTSQEGAPIKIRMWGALEKEEQQSLRISGLAYFPSLLWSDYSKFSAWLLARHGVLSSSLRDKFTAGGKQTIITNEIIFENVPKIFKHIFDLRNDIRIEIAATSEQLLCETWNVEKISDDRISQWIEIASSKCRYYEKNAAIKLLESILQYSREICLNDSYIETDKQVAEEQN